MNTNAPRGFDKLFTKSVPHILEKIFLSLDYASFNNCQEVCNEWKAFLGSEQFNRRAKYVYLDEILEIKWEERDDEENLTTYSMEGNVEEVQNLLNKGVNPNANSYETSIRVGTIDIATTPLCVAAENGTKDVVKLLLDAGAEPNIADGYGDTPLYSATKKNHTDVVKLLLNAGVEPNVADKYGDTPLKLAVHNGCKMLVKLLLDRGAEPNITDNGGRTPLYWAASRDHEDVVKLLLAAGADPNIENNLGHTPLSEAKQMGHKEVVKRIEIHLQQMKPIQKNV